MMYNPNYLLQTLDGVEELLWLFGPEYLVSIIENEEKYQWLSVSGEICFEVDIGLYDQAVAYRRSIAQKRLIFPSFELKENKNAK